MWSSTVDPEEARRAAREILSGPEYSEPEQSLVERAVDWLFGRLGDVIDTLTGGGPGSVIGWMVVVLLGGAATWLLVRALRVPSLSSPPAGDSLRYGTERHRDADVWLREAERLAAVGDHSGALRCRYQALLARLVTAGVVEDVPGRTSGEYRALLEDRLAGHEDSIGDVTRRFEAAWYGGSPVDATDREGFEADCRRIESAADISPARA